MLKFLSSEKYLLVKPADSNGRKVLTQPLHRLFLSAQMGAQYNSETTCWQILWTRDKGSQIERICNHFSRYNASYSLDKACTEISEQLLRERTEFKKLLKMGIEARRILSDDDKASILNGISKDFRRELTNHQLHAVHHLNCVINGANFSVPGSGKTSIVLAYYSLLKTSDAIDAIFVIGPASCFEPWEHEYRQCFGRYAVSVRIAGNTRIRRREIYSDASQYELLLTTYHTAARDIRDTARLLGRKRYLVVLDESHYVKRPQGGKLAEAMLVLSKFAERRVILTGTPMPNGLADLWSQLTFLWNRMLPLGKADTYLQEIQREDTEALYTDVRQRITPLFYRITKSQLGLPKPRYSIVKCDLSKLQARIYGGIAARFLTQVKETPGDREALREWRRARVIRLLQVAVNPTLLLRQCDEFHLSPMQISDVNMKTLLERYPNYELPAKVARCCELARNLTQRGKKVVIWSTFVHNLKMLEKLLADLLPVVIHGGVPYAVTDEDELSREKIIGHFKTEPDCKVLIANPAACAESISLHLVCHDAIYLDRSFNCAHYMQSLDRIHRLGLTPEDVITYYILESRETIDEIVRVRLSEKMKNMRRIVEASLPGEFVGYWDTGAEGMEDKDLDLVEKHIQIAASRT